ncbi:MAG: 4Fe-4S dicluster domain-containing protein [Candidatus Bathyarchaeum sp.]|nr:MAG: 4Fe-4S dicluster domain-containing protein [Candidatus Bathyarchaeum sp.]
MTEKKLVTEAKPSRAIKTGDLDPKFKYEISKVPGAENIKLCFQCGTCTADCPIARFSDIYRPRKLMRMTQLGMKDRVLSSEALWLCAACFTCVDHCPQGVEIASVLRALRNMAVKDGIMPAVFRELTSNIMKTGYAYRIPELRLKKRGEKGLPPLPKANVEDVAKLFDIMAVSKASKREDK